MVRRGGLQKACPSVQHAPRSTQQVKAQLPSFSRPLTRRQKALIFNLIFGLLRRRGRIRGEVVRLGGASHRGLQMGQAGREVVKSED